MIYQNIEFHNVVEMEKRDAASGGLQLHRIPKKIRETLNPRARWNSQAAPGTEIRFMTEADHIRLFISALEGDGELLVFRGDILVERKHITPGKVHCIHVTPPARFNEVDKKIFANGRFSEKVWRFMTTAYHPVFYELETYGHPVRPPAPDEKPKLKWLAYGTSITAGSGATSPTLAYPQIAAYRLGVDVLNMAMGGACMCEKSLSDFFAEKLEWDFATLEIVVNMRDHFTPAECGERAEYLIKRLVDENPGKPVVIITPFINFADYALEPSRSSKVQREYEKILNELYEKNKHNSVYMIEGREIINDLWGFNADLIHPGNYGNIKIAENLSNYLHPIIDSINK